MMRIVHLLNHVQEIGNGIVNAAVDLACAQAEGGHEVWVISGGGEYEALLHRHGVRTIRQVQRSRLVQMPAAAVSLATELRRLRPDIVHAHMLTGALLGRLSQVGARFSLVCSVQTTRRKSALMGLGNRVVAVSDAVARSLVRQGIPRSKIRTVRNGVLGSPRVQPPECCGMASIEHPAIVSVAGLFVRKGIEELIHAFSKVASDFPEAHLYLVGEGPDRHQFEQEARASRVVKRIHFVGFERSPFRYTKAADVFVLASRRDPCPLVIPEARACGRPMIASDADGIPELLEGGRAGILFPAGDVIAVEGALRKMLGDPATRARWAVAAQENIEWLTVRRNFEEMMAVYAELRPTS